MKKYLFVIAFLLSVGCQDYDKYVPVSKDDTAPPPVSNVVVEDIPGGAVLSYNLPKSESLLYVLATYNRRDTVKVETKSSYYNNSLIVEGFGDTKEREVNLYAVSRGGKKSDPVTVSIKPLTPPVTLVFRSLVTQPTFGGLYVKFENENEADVKITVLTTDSLGDYYPTEINYTEAMEGGFAARGFDSIPRKFGVFVRDRWNNYSDTIFTEVTPFYERELDKSNFSALHLDNDTWQAHRNFKPESAVWDGLETVGASAFHTSPGTGIPQWFTINLGAPVVLSRFKFFHRMHSAYSGGDPKVFEIWGSNNPSQDGSWTNWHLLGHFVNNPPSGEIPASSEDISYAANVGTDYVFPIGNDAYQYIRFKTLETWGGVDYMYIGELTFFGQ